MQQQPCPRRIQNVVHFHQCTSLKVTSQSTKGDSDRFAYRRCRRGSFGRSHLFAKPQLQPVEQRRKLRSHPIVELFLLDICLRGCSNALRHGGEAIALQRIGLRGVPTLGKNLMQVECTAIANEFRHLYTSQLSDESRRWMSVSYLRVECSGDCSSTA